MSVRAPVIVIGMHRSGTSLLTRHLEQLGLFMGVRQEANQESRFFLRANRWLLTQCGGSWNRPEPVLELIGEPDAKALAVVYLRHWITGPRAVGYLGLRRWMQGARLPHMTRPWGWKDPRTTFTLPLWLALFPEAKVLHIVRHGVDVAHSLNVRQTSILARRERQARTWFRLGLGMFYPPRGGLMNSSVGADLEAGLQLWRAHTEQARGHCAALGDRALEIRYEDFLSQPGPVLARVADFSGVEARQDQLDRLAATVRSDRAFAFRKEADLVEFAVTHQGLLRVFGYE